MQSQLVQRRPLFLSPHAEVACSKKRFCNTRDQVQAKKRCLYRKAFLQHMWRSAITLRKARADSTALVKHSFEYCSKVSVASPMLAATTPAARSRLLIVTMNEAAPPRPCEFGVGVGPLSPNRLRDCAPLLDVGAKVGLACSCHRGNDGRVNDEPRAVPEPQAVCGSMRQPLRGPDRLQLPVRDSLIARDMGPSLSRPEQQPARAGAPGRLRMPEVAHAALCSPSAMNCPRQAQGRREGKRQAQPSEE